MASMIFSTYLSFLPQNTAVFCAIALCVLFFGIYIPYQEHKKKKEPKQRKKPEPSPGAGKLDQLKALKRAGLLTEEEYREKTRNLK